MNDYRNRPLAVGDRVLIPGVIASLSEGNEDCCNVSVGGAPGLLRSGGSREPVTAINAGVMIAREVTLPRGVVLRANPGDANHDPFAEQPAQSVAPHGGDAKSNAQSGGAYRIGGDAGAGSQDPKAPKVDSEDVRRGLQDRERQDPNSPSADKDRVLRDRQDRNREVSQDRERQEIRPSDVGRMPKNFTDPA